jgi:hypothetical protein
MRVKSQAVNIIKILNQRQVDITELQKLTFNGIPDEIKGIRPLVWRVLLNHLPRDTSMWDRHLDQSKDTYELWK